MPITKLMGKWETAGIEVKDPGLKAYINLRPVLVPRSSGRHAKHQFHKSDISIVERFMNHIFVPGHRGKKHKRSSGKNVGKTSTAWKITEQVFEILEKRAKKNPVEVLVHAIENAALREEITSFQMGGIMARKAVVTAPQRRIDLALRIIVQSSFQKSSNKKKTMAEALCDEITACYNYDSANSTVIKEKERIEREAAGAR